MLLDGLDGGLNKDRLIGDDFQSGRLWAEAPRISSTLSLIASATATVFLPDCLLTTSVTAGSPFRIEALRCSSALSSATPMSRIFTA